MKTWFKKIFAALWIVIVLMQAFQNVSLVDAAVPVDYKPNYKIEAQLNDYLSIMEKVKAGINQ